MFFLLVAALTQGISFAPRTEEIWVDQAGGELSVFLRGDAHSVAVVAPSSDATLRLPGSYWHSVKVALPSGATEFLVTAPSPVQKIQLIKKKGARGAWLEMVPAHEALARRLSVRVPRTVPSAFLAPRFGEAERLMAEGKLLEAQRRFGELTFDFALKPWSELRLADIEILRGNVFLACQRYSAVVEKHGNRSTALLASIRMHALGCHLEGAPVTEPWPAVAYRLKFLGGPIGKHLWKEAVWGMGLSNDTQEIRDILTVIEEGAQSFVEKDSRIPATVLPTLVGRLILGSQPPFSLAIDCLRYQDEIKRNRNRLELTLRCAQAQMRLDLWREAENTIRIALKGKRSAGDKKRELGARLRHLLMDALVTAGEYDRAGRLARRWKLNIDVSPQELPKLPPLSPAETIVDVRQRILGAEQFVAALEAAERKHL